MPQCLRALSPLWVRKVERDPILVNCGQPRCGLKTSSQILHLSTQASPIPHTNQRNLCLRVFLFSLPVFPCWIICTTLYIFSSFRSSLEHYPWSVLPRHLLNPSLNVPLCPQLTRWDLGEGNHVFLAALLQFPFKRDVWWEKNRFSGSSVYSLLPWPPPCS